MASCAAVSRSWPGDVQLPSGLPGIPMLVTISAPSSLAIARAREGRLTLLALARNDSALVVNDPHRLF